MALEEWLGEEEEDWGRLQLSISSPVRFSRGEILPAHFASSAPAMTEPVLAPAKDVQAGSESSFMSDVVGTRLPGMVEDVSGSPGEGSEPYLPEVVGHKTTPLDDEGELEGSGKTPPDLAIASPSATATPVAVPASDVENGSDVVDPELLPRRSARQRQPPQRLQYAGLGNPLVSVVQTLFHALADAYGETFSPPVANMGVGSRIHVV
ncbi:uncharacterized protein V6R79_005860 [Siganus canaliculatus]